MKHFFTLIITMVCVLTLSAQAGKITGQLSDAEGNPVEFVNVALYDHADSSMTKVETTDLDGAFTIQGIEEGTYYLEATCVGFDNLKMENLEIGSDQVVELGEITMASSSVELEEAVVTADRAIVEIKPDRTVFNVQGTINSVGDHALNLLRKAPGVLVDNNDNITILSRSGTMVYIDGKRLPLSGEELSNYLRNIPAEQIDRIDIITNPGAKYEAEGTAGIIDIRMKRDKSLGSNGSISGTASQGRYGKGNINASGNYRNKVFNSYGQLGYGGGESFQEMAFMSTQNGIETDETMFQKSNTQFANYRWGTDFFIGEKHTVGFLLTGNYNEGDGMWDNRVEIGRDGSVDSVLVANNENSKENKGNTYNLNYMFRSGETTINVDADYGGYKNQTETYQPNLYFIPGEDEPSTEINTFYTTDTDIDIYTFLVDVEMNGLGGKIGYGGKYSQVATDNTYLFYDIPEEELIRDDDRSNQFIYDEKVFAGYVNYARPLGEKFNLSLGVRLEQTDSRGDLIAFNPELEEPPVEQNYLNAFPSAGLTWQVSQNHILAANYGRRINRPDYNVLNPFNFQISELSYMKGNPFLRPEIVNNYELGYTFKYRYNAKLSYSKTTDQITRLIGPDEEDPRAGFLTWDNLSVQHVYALNISAPVDVTKWWNLYVNANASYKDNQADYGDGAVVDVQAWSYSFFMQNTFKLPWKLTGEISGYYSGPGIWGGVFEYDPSFSLNVGLQRKFLQDRLNVRLTVNDIFYESYWSGTSSFNGLESQGRGGWDSRRLTLSVSMNFGSQTVKGARKRSTGMSKEAERVSNED